MSSLADRPTYILSLSCQDRVGIVAAVSGHLAGVHGSILDSQQYADLEAGRFFMRVELQGAVDAFPALDELRAGFGPIAARFGMDWALVPSTHKPRLLIAVSKSSHCLNDLLHRWETGNLQVDVVGVVSNHADLRGLTEWHRIPYHHFPVNQDRAEQEEKLLSLFSECQADFLVLAR
jgi:formyltetrahydrofolate deformylase